MSSLRRRGGSVLPQIVLAVLGLAVLTAVLYPVLTPVRSYSGAGCPSKMRWFAQGLSVYAQDWDGRLPAGPAWTDVLRASVTRPDGFVCPGARLKYGYAMNAAMGEAVIAKLRAPAEAVLLFESDAGVPNANGGPAILAGEDRHAGKLNWAFADGHVKRLPLVPDRTKASPVHRDPLRWRL